MSIKIVKDDLEYNSSFEIISQSMVECFPKFEDISKILSITCRVSLQGVETLGGEVRYSGIVVFNTIYLDTANIIKNLEAGAEFSSREVCDKIKQGDKSYIELQVTSCKSSFINGNFQLSALVIAKITIERNECKEYIASGEDILIKEDSLECLTKVENLSETFTLEDAFEMPAIVGKVLFSGCDILTTNSTAGLNVITTEGLASLSIIAETESGLKAYSRKINVKEEISSDCIPQYITTSKLAINSIKISLDIDENLKKTTANIVLKIDLYTSCYANRNITYAKDVYSISHDLKMVKGAVEMYSPKTSFVFNDNIKGVAILSGEILEGDFIGGAIVENLELLSECKINGKILTEGVIYGKVFIGNEDNYKACGIELPFSITNEMEGVEVSDKISGKAIVLNINATYQGGDLEVSAELKHSVLINSKNCFEFITNIEEGAEKVVNDSAISVYFAKKGSTVWDMTKEMGLSEEDILKYNAELVFPLEEDKQIICFRKA